MVKKQINEYVFMLQLGGTLALDELHFNTGEQRHLEEFRV